MASQITITIRKDTWIPSRPWCADLEVDGKKFVSWMAHFKTKRAMMEAIKAVSSARNAAVVEDLSHPVCRYQRRRPADAEVAEMALSGRLPNKGA